MSEFTCNARCYADHQGVPHDEWMKTPEDRAREALERTGALRPWEPVQTPLAPIRRLGSKGWALRSGEIIPGCPDCGVAVLDQHRHDHFCPGKSQTPIEPDEACCVRANQARS